MSSVNPVSNDQAVCISGSRCLAIDEKMATCADIKEDAQAVLEQRARNLMAGQESSTTPIRGAVRFSNSVPLMPGQMQKTIIAVVGCYVKDPGVSVSSDSNLNKDLGLNTDEMMEILITLEGLFRIEFNYNQLGDAITPQSLADAITRIILKTLSTRSF